MSRDLWRKVLPLIVVAGMFFGAVVSADAATRVGISQDGKTIMTYAFDKAGVVYQWDGNYILRLQAEMQKDFDEPNYAEQVIYVCRQAQRLGIKDALGIGIYDTLGYGGSALASITCPPLENQ